jgi:hypothetical protein
MVFFEKQDKSTKKLDDPKREFFRVFLKAEKIRVKTTPQILVCFHRFFSIIFLRVLWLPYNSPPPVTAVAGRVFSAKWFCWSSFFGEVPQLVEFFQVRNLQTKVLEGSFFFNFSF